MAPPPHPLRAAIALRAGLALAASAALAGCFTGQRPTLAEAPALSGDPAVDAVLTRLDGAGASTFTAQYELTAVGGEATQSASVVQAAPTRRAVTIGDFRFVVDGSTTVSCDLAFSDCSDVLATALVGEIEVSPDFYAAGAASRLRREADRRRVTTVASETEIAGQPAACVAVDGGNGTTTFCALESGVLARLEGSGLEAELTAYSDRVDESAFEVPN